MYHLVYLTTNHINNKIYVGVHSTYNLSYNYLGSGVKLLQAIKKYGKENFSRQILYFCLSAEESYQWERHIVTSSFIKRRDVYNIKCGGEGGLHGFRHSKETIQKISNTKQENISDEYRLKLSVSAKGVKKSEAHIKAARDTNISKAKKYIAISPSGEIFTIQYSMGQFVKDHNLSHYLIFHSKDKGIIQGTGKKVTPQVTNTIGWEIKTINEVS
jgi:hypothetical protein